MTTPTTDAIMAMADRYAFHIPGSQHSDEARAVLLAALQDQAREGEAVANSAILARGRFHAFKGEDGEPDDWEWFEEGTNCEHGCIDAVIVRADAISAPQPAQPVALPLTDERINLMVHSQHFDPSYKLKASDMVCVNWYKLGLRDGERAHGIGGAL